MTQEKLIDAITDLDSDILNRYFDMKADLAAKKKPKKRTWVKWASLAAACFVLVITATFVTQYIPTEYNLNYSYVGANGKETYIADKNVWIYYVDSGDIERERVKLPCTAENVFITWKHLNTIGDEVELIGDYYTAEDMAKDLNTISYEIPCYISNRVARIYKCN